MILSDRERETATALADLTLVNPFMPERVEAERRALGDRFVEHQQVWHIQLEGGEAANPNLPLLTAEAQSLAEVLRERLAKVRRVGKAEAQIYRDLVVYALYRRYQQQLHGPMRDELKGGGNGPLPFYRNFAGDLERFFAPAALAGKVDLPDPAHLFACFFQVRRAFHHIHRFLVGGSMPAARQRAAVWESIFSHDMRRYRRILFRHMGDVTTLITGPSGTGKELVARAIGLSRYLPFNPHKKTFQASFDESFFPLNLSALSLALIESELFGHRRGSFTGAVEDRAGWLEVCPVHGTVFLDEIGEIDSGLQVKLLRVLENRSFQRLGETQERRFEGKVIAATNRDLGEEMKAGRFREDLFYRLCADSIQTPSLAERLEDSPQELGVLVRHLTRQMVGESEVEELSVEVLHWVNDHLSPGGKYRWPGNVRELGQCIRNVLIRRSYHPPAPAEAQASGAAEQLSQQMLEGALTANELLSGYTTLVYAQAGSFQEVARRLKVDRRTVKARIDGELLELLRGGW
ncbi:MAG: sigma 54-interacting transcriptional regulator [Deltaproteobacteria bacterium]|nr:sigma 54-interacting transcriptional regulator [Deltaproteobacteria bacterium]